MDKDLIHGIISVIVIVVSVAVISVIVSKNANTANVLTSGGTALSSLLKAATGPISAAGGSSPLTSNASLLAV